MTDKAGEKRMMEWVEYLKCQSENGAYMKIPSSMSAGMCYELACELEQFISALKSEAKND